MPSEGGFSVLGTTSFLIALERSLKIYCKRVFFCKSLSSQFMRFSGTLLG